MGFRQPEGRIIVNTGIGHCDHVDPSEISEYGFKADGQVYDYSVDGKIVTVNRFRNAIRDLQKIKY